MMDQNSDTKKTPLPEGIVAIDDIQQVRNAINRIDDELLELLARRQDLSREVVMLKELHQTPLRDRNREEELLVERIHKARELGLETHYVTRLFHEIIDHSIHFQHAWLQDRLNGNKGPKQLCRVAFQGIEGAYSHLAALNYFSREEDGFVPVCCSTFQEAMEAVEKGHAEFAILPIENTTSGGINEVYDLLLHTQLSIIGEEKFRVTHCLLGLENAPINKLRKIFCHPQALLQCSQFISQFPGIQVEYFTDTAMSGRKIKQDGEPTQAAIASEEAAKHFGLEILSRGIGNQQNNFTRFLVVARKPVKVDLRIPCKSSLVISTGQESGSLVRALMVFEKHGINLTKLESRPITGNAWEEMFYVDLLGNVEEPNIQTALEELTRVAHFIKVLGSYPACEPAPTRVTPERAIHGSNPPPPTQNTVEEVEKTSTASPVPVSPVEQPEGYRLGSRLHKPEDTVIEVKDVRIGGDSFVVIAGPCAVESYEQILECARVVREAGANLLRGGCFKPRSSPYSFQGLGYEGLAMLREAGDKYDLPIVTEVLAAEDVRKVAELTDIIQIGARNMQNFSLLSEVGRMQCPILLKRGMSNSNLELLQAVEYILKQGNQQVFLCERGIRTFETSTRNTLDLGAIPYLKQRTHLPVIVDPSHAAGDRDVVPPLAMAAKAVGAHGIMIEFHPEPEKALSDGAQSLRIPAFELLMKRLLAQS